MVQIVQARGDGSADDTVAFQSAFDNATNNAQGMGVVIIPPPSYQYNISKPIVIQAGGSQGSGAGFISLQVLMLGGGNARIRFNQSNSSCFIYRGLKRSLFHGVNALLPDGVSGTTLFDARPTVAADSMNNVRFQDCSVQFGIAKSGGRNVAWRTGQISATNYGSDHAGFLWDNCAVTGTDSTAGDIAWHICGDNTIPQTFRCCSAGTVWRRYLGAAVFTLVTSSVGIADTYVNVVSTTGFPPSGTIQINSEQISYTSITPSSFTGCTRGVNGTVAASYPGTGYVVNYFHPEMGVLLPSGEMHWRDGMGGLNQFDFCVAGGAPVKIDGDRCETGGRYLQAGTGVAGYSQPIRVESVTLAGIQAADGIGFLLKCPAQLSIDNCCFQAWYNAPVLPGGKGGALGPSFITEACGVAGGSIRVTNSNVQASGPILTQTTVGKKYWPVAMQNVAWIAQSGEVLGYFENLLPVAFAS